MKKLICGLVTVMVIGFWVRASPANATLLRACSLENPPANCAEMWAVIAHVTLPRLSVVAVNPSPRCEPKFNAINWGKVVADAFNADAGPDKLENLAMDVSEAFQRKTVPQITRHIRGDAGAFIESNFSRLAPRAWSPNWAADAYDRSFCAPVAAFGRSAYEQRMRSLVLSTRTFGAFAMLRAPSAVFSRLNKS